MSLYESLPQPSCNPSWLTALKAPTNKLNDCDALVTALYRAMLECIALGCLAINYVSFTRYCDFVSDSTVLWFCAVLHLLKCYVDSVREDGSDSGAGVGGGWWVGGGGSVGALVQYALRLRLADVQESHAMDQKRCLREIQQKFCRQ